MFTYRQPPNGQPQYRLTSLDPATDRVRGKRVVLDGLPFSIAVGAGSVWVTIARETRREPRPGYLLRIDPVDRRIVARIRVGPDPRDVVVADGSVWVAGEYDDTVRRIDPSTDHIVAMIHPGDGPTDLLAGEEAIWVGTEFRGYRIAKVDTRMNRVVLRRGNTTLEAVGPDGVWVGGVVHGRTALFRLDPQTARPRGAAMRLNISPFSVAIGDGQTWLARWFEPCPQTGRPFGGVWTVFRIDPRTMHRMTNPIPLAYAPIPPLIAFKSLWLAPGPAGGGLFRIRLH
jgi:streptogramin lyase